MSVDAADASAVSWQWWNHETERPGRWSRVHYLADPSRTLCGRRVPIAGDVADFDGETCGDGVCSRCRKTSATRS